MTHDHPPRSSYVACQQQVAAWPVTNNLVTNILVTNDMAARLGPEGPNRRPCIGG